MTRTELPDPATTDASVAEHIAAAAAPLLGVPPDDVRAALSAEAAHIQLSAFADSTHAPVLVVAAAPSKPLTITLEARYADEFTSQVAFAKRAPASALSAARPLWQQLSVVALARARRSTRSPPCALRAGAAAQIGLPLATQTDADRASLRAPRRAQRAPPLPATRRDAGSSCACPPPSPTPSPPRRPTAAAARRTRRRLRATSSSAATSWALHSRKSSDSCRGAWRSSAVWRAARRARSRTRRGHGGAHCPVLAAVRGHTAMAAARVGAADAQLCALLLKGDGSPSAQLLSSRRRRRR